MSPLNRVARLQVWSFNPGSPDNLSVNQPENPHHEGSSPPAAALKGSWELVIRAISKVAKLIITYDPN